MTSRSAAIRISPPLARRPRTGEGRSRWVWLTLGLALASPSHAQDVEVHEIALTEEERRAIVAGGQDDSVRALPAEHLEEMRETARRAAADEAGERVPLSLPEGTSATTSVGPQAIPLPSGEGSVEGMGESFTPALSSGTGTFAIPIALPPGRAGVAPSFALSYGTSAGNGPVGLGWSLGASCIHRQTDRGLPRYVDGNAWHPEEDRFIYDGGHELVPVDGADVAAIDGGVVPAELVGWQQYRARVEGGFLRFFRSPDGLRWVVQSPDGSRFDLGALPPGEGPADVVASSPRALISERDGGEGRVFGWCLTRTSDAHGSVVYYRYREDGGQRYLDDVHYGSPVSCAAPSPSQRRGCTAPLREYAHRVRFVYDGRPDVFDSYVSTWRVVTAMRLMRIEITSALGAPGSRSLVRRYHLGYDASSFHSLLVSVQVEGRPEALDPTAQVSVGVLDVPEASLGDVSVGALLPAMRFTYTRTSATSTTVPGFGGIDANIRSSPSSPPVSVDGDNIDLADVNADGLPDVIVTDPARHRADGGPAMGVYFNGFRGASASPDTAGGFSDAVSVPVPSALSHVARLNNANFVPMDVDGDGRGDFLHMPRVRSYGYFAITRNDDDTAVRPSDQGWELVHVPATVPDGATDPRIDLGRDRAHIRTIDVDNDHLVDIVRTTGTRMQTWLNLGWLPEGDGRFGSARFVAGAWELSTDPIESCVLHDGLPVDFEDREVDLADMNGDGILDVVRLRRGRVVYWPGRGPGLWGEGGTECAPDTFARDRHVEMDTPPAELEPDLAGVMLLDANADGATDVVQVRFDEVDVWFNRAGHGFTPRVTARRTPLAPAFLSLFRTADVDGSGTTDLVYGDAGAWRWISPAGVRRPRLLESVDNGLGALTTFRYGSSTEDYLADLAEGTFTWSHVRGDCDARLLDRAGVCAYRSGGSAVVSTVVRSMTTTDRLDAVGREAHVATTRYAYHDAYYEGIEQEFRGFGAADAVAVGDASHPTSFARTYFLQGRRPNEIATDRLADNPFEALKGRAYLSETFDEGGRVLASAHTSWTLRTLSTGLNGLNVVFAYAAQSDTIAYDHAPYVPLADTSVEAPAVVTEGPGGAGAAVLETRSIAVHADGWAHTRTTVDTMDDLGHALVSTAHGRIRGENGETPTEAITSHQIVERLDDESGWLFATTRTWTDGPAGVALGDTTTVHDPLTGDVLRTSVIASLATAAAYELAGDADSAGYTAADQQLVTSARYDVWGNAVATCAGGDLAIDSDGCLRYAEVDYDGDYALTPIVERAAVDRAAGAFVFLSSSAEWDRGLGVVTRATDANGLVTEAGYDGLGRVTFARPPAAGACVGSTVPTTRIVYALTASAASQPVSTVTTITELSCAAVGADQLVSVGYVDGAGRVRAVLSTGDDEHAWVVAGHQVFDAKGTVRRQYQPAFLDVAAPSAAQVLALPAVPFTSARYDAFGRGVEARAADGLVVARTSYHALSQDACDANDIDPASPHYDTCATTRTDGHGREIDRVLRNRQPGSAATEHHRLFTEHREDGAVLRVVRAETVDDGPFAAVVGDHAVERRFFYDTAGRRLASTDPDTDGRDPALTALDRTWRYLFNRAGDLVAVRDPRGCGQNFYFDLSGRLLGESYVGCGEAQPQGDVSDEMVPASAIALDEVGADTHVDVRAWYDAYPIWAAGALAPPAGVAATLGYATATADRGQRSAVAYDPRGNAVWAARQIALIPEEGALPATIAGPAVPSALDGAPASGPRVYDESSTYVRTASYDFAGRPTSMELPIDPDWALLGGSGAAPVVGGQLHYGTRGLVTGADLVIDGVAQPVIARVGYERDGLVRAVVLGDDAGGAREPTVSTTSYDARRRPLTMRTDRIPTAAPSPERALAEVEVVAAQRLEWDGADNLVALHDMRTAAEWPDGFRPQTARVTHDALYRVAGVDFEYRNDAVWSFHDDAQDWRAELEATNADGETHRGADPMRGRPAPSVAALPVGRPINLTYTTDWLANTVEWLDDSASFYERSLGDITNGSLASGDRPSAMRMASSLPATEPMVIDVLAPRGGWLEVDYGDGGNVVALTVHGRCFDASASVACWDDRELALETRRSNATARCHCESEQHYQYLWDEVNRLAEARRYDRAGITWRLMVRQRMRYDGGYQRVVKETVAVEDDGEPPRRAALYVYPGDFERRGVVPDWLEDRYVATPALGTETQYVVAGARVVWRGADDSDPLALDRDHRITVPIGNLIQTTSAVLDLPSGELLEVDSYYPNGARESLRTQREVSFATEPAGFTGKEADEEVGLVYFGARYLIPRLGRWASPDPLQIHQAGGGEVGNSFHYVSANLLQARDPMGLAGADKLKRNMERELNASTSSGAPRVKLDTKGAQVHHQIARNLAADPELGDWLAGIGYDVDNAHNGIVMSSVDHNGSHAEYDTAVRRHLVAIKALNLAPGLALAEVQQLEMKIRGTLVNSATSVNGGNSGTWYERIKNATAMRFSESTAYGGRLSRFMLPREEPIRRRPGDAAHRGPRVGRIGRGVGRGMQVVDYANNPGAALASEAVGHLLRRSASLVDMTLMESDVPDFARGDLTRGDPRYGPAEFLTQPFRALAPVGDQLGGWLYDVMHGDEGITRSEYDAQYGEDCNACAD